MLVSAVLDPNAMAPENFGCPAYKVHAQYFFKGMLYNGVLLVDRQKLLVQDVAKTLNTLAPADRQKLQICFEELLKNRTKHLVVTQLDIESCANVGEESKKFALRCNADALIQTTILSDYLDSAFEQKRTYFAECLPMITDESTLREILARVTKFSKWIKLYDPYLLTSNPGFARGVKFILQLWERSCHFDQPNRGDVHLFTVPPHGSSEDYMKEKADDFVRQLGKSIRAPIVLHVKNQSGQTFHARHLQTQNIVVLVEGGFDFFTRSYNEIKPTKLAIDTANSEYLQDLRNLPDLYEAHYAP